MKLIFLVLFAFLSLSSMAKAACTLQVRIDGAISAATFDYLQRAAYQAEEKNCESLFVLVNTPGGSLQSTRLIVEKILASKIPYLCLISPAGAHAGSAGAIILQACHVSGGVRTTNIGAATPILGDGKEMGEDLRKKVLNDTVSYSESLAKLRGRNIKFAREIVSEAHVLDAEEATKIKALDFVGTGSEDFLKFAEGRKVKIKEDVEATVLVGDIEFYEPDLRYKILSWVADPEIAYMLFMGSLGLLYFEITHPGMVAPGVIGGIGLVLSLIAFHKMDVFWGGLALMLLGLAFLVAEVFVSSFGILGIGGAIAFAVGSILLFDTASTGHAVPITMILAVTTFMVLTILGLGYLSLQSMRRSKQGGIDDLKVKTGRVVRVEEDARHGQIEIQGEIWKFESETPVSVGNEVIVLSHQGLVLKIKLKE